MRLYSKKRILKTIGRRPKIIDLPYPVGRDMKTSLSKQNLNNASRCFSFNSMLSFVADSVIASLTDKIVLVLADGAAIFHVAVEQNAYISASMSLVKQSTLIKGFFSHLRSWFTPINNPQNLSILQNKIGLGG